MFSKGQLKPLTEKQEKYIKHLEGKSGLKFYGSTQREMNQFVERAKKHIVEGYVVRKMLERQEKKGLL